MTFTKEELEWIDKSLLLLLFEWTSRCGTKSDEEDVEILRNKIHEELRND